MLHKRGVNDNNNKKKPTTGTLGGKVAQKKRQADKATATARHTYSAYEAIVNSDSQIPVFLNQHHPKSKGKVCTASGGEKQKGKSTSSVTPVASAGVEGVKKAGVVTPIDILRQTGTKKPTASVASTTATVLSAEEEEKESERKRKAKEGLEGISQAPKNNEMEGTTPTKGATQPKSHNSDSKNKTSANRAREAAAAAAGEDGTSTAKALFDTIFAHDKEDSEDIKAIKETINAVAHSAVAAAASSHHLEERDTTGVLKQVLENTAHKIEEAATAAIALEIPSFADHTLRSSSSSSVSDDEVPISAKLPENH
ncbi:hypothetical protein BGW39_010044 [Mortierella sp. 14UC]|nr:hypothetical protein BGW39_010044 [Mortierella sp. 14UC]